MSANVTQRNAAADLWRVAERGDVEALAPILQRAVNINARNKHGMTALMRAAFHGHERMVRALLEHGADPNLTRNDKFTALALAAFFGHTETVRILIEHGAKTEVVTRCGASAKTWATVRTFGEVARCIETTPPPREPLVVRTLKNPPEIWDLVQVQEVPRSFNARSAFVSRLKSTKGSFGLRVAAVLLVAATCVVGALMLRGSQPSSVQPEVVSSQTAPDTRVSAVESGEKPSSEPSVTASEPEITEPPVVDAVRNHGSRKMQPLQRHSKSRFVANEGVVENVPSREVTTTAPVVSTPQIELRNSNKANTGLSPHLITPTKSAAPKAKVIQWP